MTQEFSYYSLSRDEMMRLIENKNGQFIIIAVMIIAIMMVSLTVTMYNASTYYKSERWEEYITLIDHVKLNTIRLVELSLANYTNNLDSVSILKANLINWQGDLRKAYPGQGVVLAFELSNGLYEVYNISVFCDQGLASSWNQPASLSVADATFTLSFTSIGLEGYKFEATPFVYLKILNATSSEIFVAVKGEDAMPITELKKGNFNVAGVSIVKVTSHYDRNEVLVYKIVYEGVLHSPATVTVRDLRGIKATAATS